MRISHSKLCVLRISFVSVAVLFLNIAASAQSTGEYRSAATGLWSAAASWQTFNGSSWVAAASAPTGGEPLITVLNTHNITISGATSITLTTGLDIASGGTLTLAGASPGTRLTIGSSAICNNYGTITVSTVASANGMIINGTFNLQDLATFTINSPAKVTFASGSIYNHLYTATAGTIPNATWNTNSTCRIVGYTSNSSAPGGLNPTGGFGNFEWNCLNQGSLIDLAGGLQTVKGNLNLVYNNFQGTTLNGTNSSYTLTITGNLNCSEYFVINQGNGSTTVNVAGNVNVDDPSGLGYLVLTNSTLSSGSTTLNVTGALTVNNGCGLDFSLAAAGAGTINLKGNYNALNAGYITGGFGTGVYNFVFNGTSLQTVTESQQWAGINISIPNLAIVSIPNGGGTNFLGTDQTFTLSAGGTLQVGSTDVSGALQSGVSGGNLRVSGTKTFTAGSNIVYNGSGAQAIGNGFPASAVNLEINNSSGVTNNNNGTTNVIGNLTLTSGPFIIGSNNTLNIQSNLSVTAGTIGGGSTSSLTLSGSGSLPTSLPFQSGSNQLLNFTISRSGTVVLGTDLTINGVLSFASNGNLDISNRILTIQGNAGNITQTGAGNILSNLSSSLIFNANGAVSTIPFSGSQLGTLTFNNAGTASYTIASAVTVTNQLNLGTGTLTHASGLTMGTGSTFARSAGTTYSGSAPSATSSYNVSYSGNLSTGLELPSSSTALNNLTVAGNVSLTQPITINGSLTLNSGTFSTSSNAVTIAGASFVANGGTYNAGALTTFSRSGTTTLSGSTISGIQFAGVTINSGATLAAPSGTINVSGDWNNSGGFTPNGGMVIFNGAAQNVASNNVAFSNVTFAGSSTKTLTQDMTASNSLTISTALTVTTQTITLTGLWTDNGTFTRGTGTVVFSGNCAIAGSSNTTFKNVTISGTLASPATFNVAGNFVNNGTFNAGVGTVNFKGTTSSQTISGSTATAFNNMTVTNPLGVSVTGTARLNGTFTLSGSGVFDADGPGTGTFIVSSIDQTTGGMIAALGTPSNFSGNVTIERYIHGLSGGDWRYLSMPITGATALLSLWRNSIYVTGAFSDHNTSSDNANIIIGTKPSVFTFNSSTQAYVAVTGASTGTTAISSRTGYSAYDFNNGAVTASYRGPIETGSVPVTISSTNGNYNLIPNPYPSPIDWDNNAHTNVNNAMYLRIGNNVFTSYVNNVATNAPTGTWTGEIASGQSFFVVSNGGGSTFTFTEADKTSNGYTFLRTRTPDNLIRIALSNENNITDEAVVRFVANASNDTDVEFDAEKLPNLLSDPDPFGRVAGSIPNLSTFNGATSKDYAINSIALLSASSSRIVNIDVSDLVAGNYNLRFSDLSTLTLGYRVYLVDRFAKKEVEVTDGMQYDFAVNEVAQSKGSYRFYLRFQTSDFIQQPSSVDVITGLGDLNYTGLSVYPNPVVDKLQIHLSDDEESRLRSVRLYDVLGKVAVSSETDVTLLQPGVKTINMTGWTTGVYLLTLEIGEQVKTFKILKK